MRLRQGHCLEELKRILFPQRGVIDMLYRHINDFFTYLSPKYLIASALPEMNCVFIKFSDHAFTQSVKYGSGVEGISTVEPEQYASRFLDFISNAIE